LTEPLLLDIHRTLGYLLGLHAHWLTTLSQSNYNYQCIQNWLPLLRAGIDDISNNYVSKIIKHNKYLIALIIHYYFLNQDECAKILISTYKESCKSVDSHIQYGTDHPVEEVIQNVSKVLVKHLNLNKTEINEKGKLINNI